MELYSNILVKYITMLFHSYNITVFLTITKLFHNKNNTVMLL